MPSDNIEAIVNDCSIEPFEYCRQHGVKEIPIGDMSDAVEYMCVNLVGRTIKAARFDLIQESMKLPVDKNGECIHIGDNVFTDYFFGEWEVTMIGTDSVRVKKGDYLNTVPFNNISKTESLEEIKHDNELYAYAYCTKRGIRIDSGNLSNKEYKAALRKAKHDDVFARIEALEAAK